MELYYLLDIAVILILGVCAFHGFRRGFILGIGGLVSLFIAIWGAQYAADMYSKEIEPAIEPFLIGVVDNAINDAQYPAKTPSKIANGAPNEPADEPAGEITDEITGEPADVYEISLSALGSIGIFGGAAEEIAEEMNRRFDNTGETLRQAMASRVTAVISYAAVAAVAFIAITIVFAIVLNLINLAFNLPGPLKLLNDIGGAVLGLVKGLIFVFAIAWALRFLGVLLPADTIERTSLLKFFAEYNPLSSITLLRK